jgi:hypothetical protein
MNDRRVMTVLLLLAMIPGACRNAEVERRPPRPTLEFLVTTIGPKGVRTSKAAAFWDGAVDEDTVVAVVPGLAERPDSVRILGRSGPVALIGDLPNATRADSLGEWVPLPDSILMSKGGGPTASGYVIGMVVPRSVINWARKALPARPYLTRIAVVVSWKGNPSRGELEIGHGL